MNAPRLALVLLAASFLFFGNAPPGRSQGKKALPAPDLANVKYRPHARNVLDLWKAPSDKPTPLVVFIHGGGFRGGSKEALNPALLDGCLKSGISVMAINYRLSPEVHFPAHYMDSARAIQFARHQAKAWNIDAKRIAATGGSAGAGTSLWIGFHDDMADPKSDDPVLRRSTRLSCMAVQGAQSTYDPRVIKKIVGGRAHEHPALEGFYGLKKDELDTPRAHKLYDAAAPINYLTADDPPVYAFYNEPTGPLPADAKPGQGIHHINFGLYLKEKMDALKIECVVRHQKDQANPTAEMVAFFKKHLSADGKQDAAKKKPRFTIGKETTFVLEPVDAAGYIDYAHALNERSRRGATADNNANVLFWKAFGPHPEGAKMPPEYFKWLDIPAPPKMGDYYVGQNEFLKSYFKKPSDKKAADFYEETDRLANRPWKAQESPHVAAWLKENQKPLALVAEGTRRTHYFSPMVPFQTNDGPSGLMSALLPGVQKCREFAHALSIRAMLHLGEGREEEAWQDLLTCHRLARHVARGSTMIEGLVGIAIDNIASHAGLVYLERAGLNAAQLKQRLADLQKLPPLPPMADKVALGERFMFLDTVMLLERHGFEQLGPLAHAVIPHLQDPQDNTPLNIHWDPALRAANRWYDRTSQAMRHADRAVREKQLDDTEEELKKLKKSMTDAAKLKELQGKNTTPEARGQIIGDIMLSLLVPAVRKVNQAGDRGEQIQRNLHLAFALAAHKQEKQAYPAKLSELAPMYLTEVPKDVFTGKDLVYRPTENGYLLYSFGPNGQDDQGRWYDDTPSGDDPRVGMPLPARKEK